MKKIICIACLFLITFTMKAQNATIENGVAKYNDRTFAVNDTITLGYGSQANKDFAFILIGSGISAQELQKNFAKNKAVIERVYRNMGQVWIRAKLTDKTVNLLGGNKLFINIEAAIDNKELN